MTKRGAIGKRSVARRTGVELAKAVPDEMRAYLAPHARLFCDALLADVRDPDSAGHRTAMGLYPQIMKVVGAQGDLLAELLAQLNLSSMEELVRRVELARSTDETRPEEADRAAADWLRSRGWTVLEPGKAVRA